MRTASQVLQVSIDDDEKTFVDGDDEPSEMMTYFTRENCLISYKTLPKTTDYPGWSVSSTLSYDR